MMRHTDQPESIPFFRKGGYHGNSDFSMNIGIDASFLRRPGTGIGQVTANFLRKLAGFSVSATEIPKFILYTEEPIDLAFPENFEVKAFLPRWWRRDDVPRRILWERELTKRAAADGCDVFLSLSQSSTRFQNFPRMRHIMVVHDIIPRLFPEYLGTLTRRFHWKAIEQGIRSADALIAVSETTKEDIVSKLGIPAKNITVASPDCDPSFREGTSEDDVARVMKKYALEPGYLYHGGGLEIRKNAERLLHAYVQLKKERSKIPPLVISGKVFPKGNHLATDIRGIIRELGLEESVVVLGFVPDEDLPALYRGASLFIYPSLYEGFGLPVLEAFVSGTPVIAGRAGAVPELAQDAALLVDPTRTEDIAAGMARLLDDAALRTELAENGRRRAEDFSWDSFLETTMRIIREKRR